MNIPDTSVFRNPKCNEQFVVCICCSDTEKQTDPVDPDRGMIYPVVWSVYDPQRDLTVKYGFAYGYGGGLGTMIDAQKKARKYASAYFRRLNKKAGLTNT